MIKRPVLETCKALLVGFRPEEYEKAFPKKK
jgi:arsenate reductase-like glutaredoxin family protein